jgi:hypothetical protein
MLPLLALVLPLSGALLLASRCPVCGGKLARAGSLNDDTTAPSRNICVWNRSICGNLLYGPDSVVCTRCWYARSPQLRQWERRLGDPDGFRQPLRPEVRRVPLPTGDRLRYSAVFWQAYADKAFTDGVAFWCADDAALLSRLRDYCTTSHLTLTAETATSQPGAVCINIK